MRSPYLTARELAALRKINIDTVYDLAARKQIPGTRIGNQWRLDKDEIRVWFRQGRDEPAEGQR